ncbi:MAG: hypothetical protein DRJ09_01040 [Bacteroidetes bacterium]|nr:MAG: hypothetical protein DRJ09_01040 [Bacteroidota bacterium]
MKWYDRLIKSKRFQQYLGWITLLMLVMLLVLKLIIGHCELWLCGLFVLTVTGYYILSDLASRKR